MRPPPEGVVDAPGPDRVDIAVDDEEMEQMNAGDAEAAPPGPPPAEAAPPATAASTGGPIPDISPLFANRGVPAPTRQEIIHMSVIVQEQLAAQTAAPPVHTASPTQTTDAASSQQLAEAVPRPKPVGGRGARARGSNPYPLSGKGRGSPSKGRFPGPVCGAPADGRPAAPEIVDLATPPTPGEREGSAPAALDRKGRPDFKLPSGALRGCSALGFEWCR